MPTLSSEHQPPMSSALSNTARDLSVLAFLLIALMVLSCFTLTLPPLPNVPDGANFRSAVLGVAFLLIIVPFFLRARFSFGYLLAVPFCVTVIGFVWITYSSGFDYNHDRARWSAVASLLCLLLPLLFQVAPLRPPVALSVPAMNRLLLGLLALAALVLLWAASYGFAFVSPYATDGSRSSFLRPTVLNYVIGALLGAVLPYAFATFAWQRRYLVAALSLMLIVAFYPVVLNKTVLLAAAWLPILFLLFRLFEPRRAALFAVLMPMLFGLLAYQIANHGSGFIAQGSVYVYGNISMRMFAYPSIAMDRYSDFFAHHDVTHFCQIGVIRALLGCPYNFQLGQEMQKAYDLGSLNASLLATEGIASVGPIWAPLSALFCGLVLSVGNSVSGRLPPAVLAGSAGVIEQTLMNVPLTTNLLTNGLLVLWLLWLITPEAGDATSATRSSTTSSA